ncbi:hypothetical protein OH77DRAFT_1515684 [Trametes cingulata]|nr:hypothetical protein OH77DRAFT_1515684 [Trametes cingulata]
MVLSSPSASLASKLVFWSPEDDSPAPDESPDINTAEVSSTDAQTSTHDGVSMYVKVFEEMLMEVIDGEGGLFVASELDCFMKYHRLPYAAKYLFCRLCLRKTDKWHRLSSLKYQAELGDGIRDAVDILCGRAQPSPPPEEDVKPVVEDIILPDFVPTFRLDAGPQVKLEPDAEPEMRLDPIPEPEPEVKPQVKQEKTEAKPAGSPKLSKYHIIQEEDREIIDLTFDDDEDEQEKQPEAGPSCSPVYEPASPSLTPRAPDYSVFADDEEQATLLELLDCLTTDELVDIAKQLKIKRQAKRRDTLIEDILRSSSTQGTLAFPVVSTRKGKDKTPMMQSKLPFGSGAKSKPLMQTTLPFKPQLDPTRTQQDRVREIVMQELQKCIRLNADVVALFRRANLVYFRSTQHTPELLTPALLARARKWTYAAYPYARTRDVWRDRAALLAYEEALAVEAEVDALLDSGNGVGGWGRGRSRSTASQTPAPGPGAERTKTPVTPRKAGGAAVDSPATTRKGRGGGGVVEEEESVRVKNARAVRRIVLENVFPKWQALVAAEPEVEDDDGRRKALQRFECGHVLTRVVCKGAHALGILHEYALELQLLDALLAQTRWRRGRRGRWHERRALLLMQHLRADDADEAALAGVVAALTDPDTHVVFRPMLERRLTRLEKRLRVPEEERHECAGGLRKAREVWVVGVRVDRRLLLDEAGRVVNQDGVGGKEGTKGLLRWAKVRSASPRKRTEEVKPEKVTGKSIWKGRDGEEVTVETLALQHYEDNEGCKGFHSEGRIVTTLFGLLFWDVLFAPIPGAFETRYQAAPLDLAEDTFYHARQALADARLAEIEAGRAAELVGATYEKHQGEMCVGVRWDLFGREDVVGIAKCLSPAALAVICRLMCEDYAARTGGVPDLIVWNEKAGWAKFVEVKGPNDTLQENQKVWIDVLVQAGVTVEVCHVHEPGQTPKKAKKAKGTKKTPRKTGQKRKRAEPDSDEEDVVRIVESEDEDTVDYDQMDVHTEDEEDEPPTRKRRRKNVHPATILEEPESPVAEKVVRLNSQPEVMELV